MKREKRVRFSALSVLLIVTSAAVQAQDPISGPFVKLAETFTGPLVRAVALIAIVVGGLSLAFGEGSGKRAIGGLVFGLGMALGATQLLTWLFV